MLKKIAFAIALFVIPFMGVKAQYKFGHINSEEIITAMPEFVKANAELKDLGTKYTEDLKKSQSEFDRKYQEFMQQKDSLPQAIGERRQKELEDMAARIRQSQQDAQDGMQKAQEAKLAPILQKVDAAVKAVGQAEGMIYIFDIAHTPIAYINEAQSVNLTPKVKARVGATATTAAKAPAARAKK
jgi:outer membrane protein